MTVRNTILNTLKSEMEDYIKTSRGYNTDPVKVIRGVIIFEDVEQKPALSFWCFNEENRFLHIYIYGFCDTDGYGDVDEIHKLLGDLEYFLYNDFTYTDDTDIGDSIVYEGGVSDPVSEFRLEIRIRYKNTTTNR
jgi:hypothetical protein